MVTSPDQLKPGHSGAARALGIGSAVFLLLLLFGNHRSHTENLWLIVLAIGLIGIFVVDWALRRNGLRR
ncbi:MAG: DUF2631 domain-containing protein [Actinomycetota bacterium]|nr:DUF2631 domain-containing protein [Actinomycetota bacterium]